MNLQSLKPAGQFAHRLGVKSLIYGPPGTGKTPIINTAPNPVLLACEPGLLSMRGSQVPTFEAYNVPAINEFFKWFFESPEAKKFDTLAVDSVSQMCEIILTHELSANKDGRKAFGEMSRKVMEYMNKLYFMPEKHLYLIAKQAIAEENGTNKRKPYFPGQDLNVKIPHLFDLIMHFGLHNIPGVMGAQKAFCTSEQFDLLARDRSGKLSSYEPPNLSDIFNKAMQ
jgi:hypothetical protein